MKQFLKCLIIICLISLGIFLYFTFKNNKNVKNIEDIKKGWYVEIIYKSPINVRKEANENADSIGKVKEGEIYKVLDIDTTSSNIYFWYKIDFNGQEGWIASGKKNHWVNDYNNPTDILTPEITFEDDIYNVRSINDINYKHLKVIEDSKDYTITHQIYFEKDKDQYWIKYTIKDKSGKKSSKTQRIIFEINPSEDDVLDFSLFTRD